MLYEAAHIMLGACGEVVVAQGVGHEDRQAPRDAGEGGRRLEGASVGRASCTASGLTARGAPGDHEQPRQPHENCAGSNRIGAFSSSTVWGGMMVLAGRWMR